MRSLRRRPEWCLSSRIAPPDKCAGFDARTPHGTALLRASVESDNLLDKFRELANPNGWEQRSATGINYIVMAKWPGFA